MKTDIKRDSDIESASTHQRRSMLAVTQSCSRWRQVALSTPTLWTHIYINPDSEALVKYARRSVMLSKRTAIVVYFRPSIKGGDLRLSLGVALEDASRVRKPVINGYWKPLFYSPWDIVFGDATILEELVIVGDNSFVSPLNFSRVDSLGFQSTSSLQHIRIGLSAPKIVTQAHFANLRSLIIDFQRSDVWDIYEAFPEFLCAAPHRLEELTICRSIPITIHPTRRSTDFSFGPDRPLEFPFLRILVAIGVKLGQALDVLLSSLRIPDSAIRRFLVEGMVDSESVYPPSLDDLVLRGRMSLPAEAERVGARRLQLVLVPGEPGYLDPQYLAVEEDTITLNSNAIPWTRSSPFFDPVRGLVAEVEELVIIVVDPVGPVVRILQHLLPALPSLRRVVFSTFADCTGPGPLGELVEMLCKPTGRLPPMHVLCPLFESIELLFSQPGCSRTSSVSGVNSRIQDTLPMLVELVEGRQRLGRPLKDVVIEGCPNSELYAFSRLVETVSGERRSHARFEEQILQSIESCRCLSA